MTQGEKELLFKDLCARLPYDDYKVQIKEEEDDVPRISKLVPSYIDDIKYCTIASIKVYLRPMSSMTEKELDELRNYTGLLYDNLDLASFQNRSYKCLDFYLSEIPADVVIKVFDWLHMHHFDYRGLIEQSLALEAPEGMYKV